MRLWKWFLVIFGFGLVLGILFGDASALLLVVALTGIGLTAGIVVWELKQVGREWTGVQDRGAVAIQIGSTVLLCSAAALTIGGLLTVLVGH